MRLINGTPATIPISLLVLLASVGVVHGGSCELKEVAEYLRKGDISTCTLETEGWTLSKVLAAVQHIERPGDGVAAHRHPACSATTLPSIACDCLNDISFCGGEPNFVP